MSINYTWFGSREPLSASTNDNFNRADASTLGSSWSSLAGTMGVLSNKAYFGTSFGAGELQRHRFATDLGSIDMFAEAVFNGLSTGGYSDLRLMCRWNNSNQFYELRVNNAGEWYVNKVISPGVTESDIVSGTGLTLSFPETWKIEVTGTDVVSIRIFRNGTQIGSYVDANSNRIVTGNNAGIGGYTAGGSPPDCTLDDFAIGTVESYVLPGTVGYLGLESSLTDQSDVSGVITLGPGTYDHIYFRDMIYLSGVGDYLFTNCIIEGTQDLWGIMAYDANLTSASTVILQDTTLRWKSGDTFSSEGQGAIVNLGVSLSLLRVERCDISGKADGLQIAGTVEVIDCYIHDLVWAGTPPDNTHNDGIQSFEGTLLARGNYILVGATTPYSNSCMFFQGADITTVLVERNYMSGGGYSYYAQNGQHTVRYNMFNVDNTAIDHRLRGHLFSTHTFEGAGPTVMEWAGNISHVGDLISL